MSNNTIDDTILGLVFAFSGLFCLVCWVLVVASNSPFPLYWYVLSWVCAFLSMVFLAKVFYGNHRLKKASQTTKEQ